MTENKTLLDWFAGLFEPEKKKPLVEDKIDTPTLQPALLQIGITDCPICKHKVAVFLTKTKRPFVNCGFCSARIFYNGREAMRLLKKRMDRVKEGLTL